MLARFPKASGTGLVALCLLGTLLGSHVTVAATSGQTSGCLEGTTVGQTVVNGDRQQDYRYPYRDPYVATITTAVMNPDGLTPGLRRQVVHVSVLPGRNHLPSLEGRGRVSIALYRQHRPAPLMFIVSGIGSSPYFGLATYFASLFHREGLHVVILPSPMNWNFALAASRSGTPGYAPDDARDLYEVMQRTLQVLRDRYHVEITGIDFMGASLGALEGAYLSVLDADQRSIGIQRYLLVNPPLDLSYALTRLDEWDALRDELGNERAEAIQAKALAIIQRDLGDMRDGAAAVDRLAKDFSRFTTEELQFLVAQYVQTALPELVYATQVIHDQHVLTAAGKDQVRKRLQEAKSFSLRDYMERIAIPWLSRRAGGPRGDPESLSRQGSLMTILARLRGNPRVYIMHNADDVLVDTESLEEVREAMGHQMTVYRSGGHLGNLWYWQNKECILKLFRESPESATHRAGLACQTACFTG